MNDRREDALIKKPPGLVIARAKARLLRDIGRAEGTTNGGVDLHPRLYPPFGPAEIWERNSGHSRVLDAKPADIFPITGNTTGPDSDITIASTDDSIFLEHDPLLIIGSSLNAIAPAAVKYKGGWNAATNQPALASGTGTAGDLYLIRKSGSTTLNGISSWRAGEWLIFDSGSWQKRPATDGLNDLAGSCRANAGIASGVLTIKTDLNLQVAGELGSVIRLVPPPNKKRIGLIVNRWHDADLTEGMIVEVVQEFGSEWWDIASGSCTPFEETT